jgi:serine/threonine-protein kinase
MLWQALTGRRLWRGQNDDQVIRQVLAGKLPSPSELVPGCAPELERICMKAMAHDRNDRYSTAAEMRAEIEEFLQARRASLSTRQLSVFMTRRFEGERQLMAQRVQSLLVAIEPEIRPRRSSRPPRDSRTPTVVTRRPETSLSKFRAMAVPIAAAAAIAALISFGVALSNRKGKGNGSESGSAVAEPGAGQLSPPPAARDVPTPYATGRDGEGEAAALEGEDIMPMPMPMPAPFVAPPAASPHEHVSAPFAKNAGTHKSSSAERDVAAPPVLVPPASCSTPFTVDQGGIKRFKADCL